MFLSQARIRVSPPAAVAIVDRVPNLMGDIFAKLTIFSP